MQSLELLRMSPNSPNNILSDKTYLEIVRNLVYLSINEQSQHNDIDNDNDIMYQILIDSMFELSFDRDNIIYQSEYCMSVLKSSMPILHDNIKKFLYTNDNIKKIKLTLNQTTPKDCNDAQSYIDQHFYTNYFNVRNHLTKFMTEEALKAIKDDIFENLRNCIEILYIGLLIYEFEKNNSSQQQSSDSNESEQTTSGPDHNDNQQNKPTSSFLETSSFTIFEEEINKLKLDYPDFFNGMYVY